MESAFPTLKVTDFYILNNKTRVYREQEFKNFLIEFKFE